MVFDFHYKLDCELNHYEIQVMILTLHQYFQPKFKKKEYYQKKINKTLSESRFVVGSSNANTGQLPANTSANAILIKIEANI